MSKNKYKRLVMELTSLIEKFKEFEEIKINAEFDLKWRLSQLYQSVKEEDEQKFIVAAGLQGHLLTTKEKQEIEKLELEKENIDENNSTGQANKQGFVQGAKKKNGCDKKWVKELYRKSVKRCHPDIVKGDKEYVSEMTEIYKSITKAYEDLNLDILMVEAYKVFIKPTEVVDDQIEILQSAKKEYNLKIDEIIRSQGFVWSNFNEDLKENFIINFMKSKGIRFVDKEKVREVLRRKPQSRKAGQKPKNRLRDRVKNKK